MAQFNCSSPGFTNQIVADSLSDCPLDYVTDLTVIRIYEETRFMAPLSYVDAGQLIGAVALLFSVAFILRSVRKHIGF